MREYFASIRTQLVNDRSLDCQQILNSCLGLLNEKRQAAKTLESTAHIAHLTSQEASAATKPTKPLEPKKTYEGHDELGFSDISHHRLTKIGRYPYYYGENSRGERVKLYDESKRGMTAEDANFSHSSAVSYRADVAEYHDRMKIYEANKKKVTFYQSDLTLAIEKCEDKIKQFATSNRIEINRDAIPPATAVTGMVTK